MVHGGIGWSAAEAYGSRETSGREHTNTRISEFNIIFLYECEEVGSPERAHKADYVQFVIFLLCSSIPPNASVKRGFSL